MLCNSAYNFLDIFYMAIRLDETGQLFSCMQALHSSSPLGLEISINGLLYTAHLVIASLLR